MVLPTVFPQQFPGTPAEGTNVYTEGPQNRPFPLHAAVSGDPTTFLWIFYLYIYLFTVSTFLGIFIETLMTQSNPNAI